MLTTAASAISALIAVSAAVYAWIQTYDQDLRLDKIERGYSSMNSRIGKIKQDAVREAKEIARSEAGDAAAAASQSNGGGGLDMQALLPMMMGQMGGGDNAPRNNDPEPQEKQNSNIIGSGGVTNGTHPRG